MNWPKLLRVIIDQYRLRPAGRHGVAHWARVLENGLCLSEQTGANTRVIELFAVFHDACRVNDGWDPGHGERGAELATQLRGKYFDLPDDDFAILTRACCHHTGGRQPEDITVLTCWDSDRLDLLRVGIVPNPRYLVTEPARAPEMLDWANERAKNWHLPLQILEKWGLDEHFHWR